MFGIKAFEKTFQFEDLPMMLAWLTGIMLLLASFVIVGGLPWFLVAGLVALYAAVIAVGGYLQAKKKGQCQDERTLRNATRAARNGYLLALVAIGAAAMTSALLYVSGKDPRLMLIVFLGLAVVLTMAYSLSYAYYTDRDLM